MSSGQNVKPSTTGHYALSVNAKDRDGNTASKTVTFTVIDKVAPMILITSPEAKSYPIGLKLAIKLPCTDSSGIAGCTGIFGRVGTKAGKFGSGKKITLSKAGHYVLRITARTTAATSPPDTSCVKPVRG